MVSQAQIRIPGGGYLTIEKIFLNFFQPLFLMYEHSAYTVILPLFLFICILDGVTQSNRADVFVG